MKKVFFCLLVLVMMGSTFLGGLIIGVHKTAEQAGSIIAELETANKSIKSEYESIARRYAKLVEDNEVMASELTKMFDGEKEYSLTWNYGNTTYNYEASHGNGFFGSGITRTKVTCN